MRILLINTDYPHFLKRLYRGEGDLATRSYHEQLDRRNKTLFGSANFMSGAFERLGHKAADVYANNPWLQHRWALEHGMKVERLAEAHLPKEETPALAFLKRKLRPYRNVLAPVARVLGTRPVLSVDEKNVLLAQMEEFSPDVILNTDLAAVDPSLLRAAKKRNCLIVGYCGINPPPNFDFSAYDLCLSMLDWVVATLLKRGVRAEKSHLAFEPLILDCLSSPAPTRDIAVSFVGSIFSGHSKRLALLEAIAHRFPLALWLANASALPAASPLRPLCRGEAYGRDAYEIMRRSLISLNSHVDAARGQAANVRQFEATGVGSLLLTDNCIGLKDLFEEGHEVATYASVEEALTKIAHYLGDAKASERMALAGQQRTLRNHTYANRAAGIAESIERLAS